MEISNLEKLFDVVEYRHVIRTDNYDADLQAKLCY
jgi:hypothetical protein